MATCPSCRANAARVVATRTTKNNERIRRRHCHNCGHRWYTLQPPEIEISTDEVQWNANGISYIPQNTRESEENHV